MPPGGDPVELLHAARAGQAAAWGRLLEHYRPYLTLLAEVQVHKRLRVKADAGDLVQETFLRAHQDFPTFRGASEPEFLVWLRAILATRLARLARTYLGAQQRDARLEREWEQGLADSSRTLDVLHASSSGSPSRAAARREEAVRLAAALERLTPDHRAVLVLRHVEGVPFAEAGARMGRSEAAAGKLWTRAVAALKDLLEEGPRDPTPGP